MNNFPEVEQEIVIGWPNRFLVFTGEWREFPNSHHAEKNMSIFVPVYRNKETGTNELMMTMSVSGAATQPKGGRK